MIRYEAIFEENFKMVHLKSVCLLWWRYAFKEKYQLIFLFSFFRSDEVQAIVSGKLALKYSGPAVEAMKSIAQASHKRSLADFQKVFIYLPTN